MEEYKTNVATKLKRIDMIRDWNAYLKTIFNTDNHTTQARIKCIVRNENEVSEIEDEIVNYLTK